jgi:hypothetical protein
MEEIMINIKGWNSILNKKYKDKDLISLEDLIADYENALGEIEELEDKIEELQNPEEYEEDRYEDIKLGLI